MPQTGELRSDDGIFTISYNSVWTCLDLSFKRHYCKMLLTYRNKHCLDVHIAKRFGFMRPPCREASKGNVIVLKYNAFALFCLFELHLQVMYHLDIIYDRGGLTHTGISKLSRHWFRYWLIACSPVLGTDCNENCFEKRFEQENEIDNVVCKMTAILFRFQFVNWLG